MSSTPYSVTLHHLAPGAKAAGLGYPDEQLPAVTDVQLVELLHALEIVAAKLTIYEPSNPEIRIKTDREVHIVRTHHQRLCFVGREAALRGENHSVAFIMSAVSGLADTALIPALRPAERPVTSHPMGSRHSVNRGGGVPEWFKIALLLVLSLSCLGGGVWMLLKPAKPLGPKFSLLTPAETSAMLSKAAGEYRTGTQDGDRRLVIGADGTLLIAKYGPGQTIVDEVIRTTRGARQGGQTGLATNDPYLLLIRDNESVVLYGQTYKRIAP